MSQTRPQLPIGYWLKQVDNLLTEQINKAQATHGVSRTEWQVLNLMSERGSVGIDPLHESVAAFVDRQRLDEIMAELVAKGWAAKGNAAGPSPALYQLTDEGRRQHGVILATQKAVRQQAMQGISDEEYATVMRVLQQMASNLGGEGR